MALDDLGCLTVSQNQTTLTAVLGAADATPIGTAILAEQIIVDDDQRSTALAVDVLEAWRGKGGGGREMNLYFNCVSLVAGSILCGKFVTFGSVFCV